MTFFEWLTWWAVGGIIISLAVLLSRVLTRRSQERISQGRCQWCDRYISQEDRERRYQTNGGNVMCPHCWEYTKVDEHVFLVEWEILT